MSVEILPCPFCGQELERTTQKINQTARCVTDGCRGGKMPSVILESPQDVAAWNTRHAPNGFALVPVEPSKQLAWSMIKAGAEAVGMTFDQSGPTAQDYDHAVKSVQAMIAAAQAQPE